MKFKNFIFLSRAGKNTKVGTPTLPEAMRTAVAKMAPDRHVANRVIILVSAMYCSADIQEWSDLGFQRENIDALVKFI